MTLTPCKHDPNRKKELERKKDDPLSFGANQAINNKPKDWAPSQLKESKEKK